MNRISGQPASAGWQTENRTGIEEISGDRTPIAIAHEQSDGILTLDPNTDLPTMNRINPLPIIIIDGIFFQLYRTGIARVWQSLLQEWSSQEFAQHLLVLDRNGTAPRLPNIYYLPFPPYVYENLDRDREMLQQVCDQEGASLFISTYFTAPLSTPSVLMVHDMIPEVLGADLAVPEWQEKHHCIKQASAYITVSQNTARDLMRFFPEIAFRPVTIAYPGVSTSLFFPETFEEIYRFKSRYGISKPYFLLSAVNKNYKNNRLFFAAFAQLCSRHGFEIVCTGGDATLNPEFRTATTGCVVHLLSLTDEELRAAYAGAVALVYPSLYEGFGLPVLEAMACGCPTITCPNASLPEVAGEAVLYVHSDDVDGMAEALCEVQKPSVRKALIAAGLKRSQSFSWSRMAAIVQSALVEATLLPLQLRDVNLIVFPDWQQPETILLQDLEMAIRTVLTYPEREQLTLLVYTGNGTSETANLALSEVTLNLLMAAELERETLPEVSLVPVLSEMQWQALLPRLQARLELEHEDEGAIAQVGADRLQGRSLS
ncbi:MAG: glycosyltransferase family 4 protein [Leptolyngbyaceae cyanobacterium HOT.MB2.61]|nr:glycosyltransferase family 4 protein [Leptolyngbyaceae cyanobacterium HOT.MB2.61]